MKKFLAKYKLRTKDEVLDITERIEAATFFEAYRKAKNNDRFKGWTLLFVQEVESLEDIWSLL